MSDATIVGQTQKSSKKKNNYGSERIKSNVMAAQDIPNCNRCRPSKGRRCIPDVIISIHVETYLNVGVLFENRPALYFFYYTFISAYKIYFLIPYQRYCFRSSVCATEFHCIIMILKMEISSVLSIKFSINKVSNIRILLFLFSL